MWVVMVVLGRRLVGVIVRMTVCRVMRMVLRLPMNLYHRLNRWMCVLMCVLMWMIVGMVVRMVVRMPMTAGRRTGWQQVFRGATSHGRYPVCVVACH